MRFLVWVVVNAGAIALATWLLPGIRLTEGTEGRRLGTLLVVAVVFGLVNAVVRPVVSFVAFPLIVLTLGLLILVINALMLMLTGWVSTQLGLGFRVDGFGTALVGGLIAAIAAWVLGLAFRDA